MIVYIAGPMTGIDEYNYPAFNSATKRLRTLGFIVENPAENPEPEGMLWQSYMRMSVVQIAKSDMVALLPGWEQSRGARLEFMLANELGLKVIKLEELLDTHHQ